MARVPQAQPVGALGFVQPTVGPSAFDNTRASEAFGASVSGIGSAVQDFGGQVINLAIENQIEDNENELAEALIRFNQQKNAIGFGDGTAQNPGFYGLNGSQAVESDGQTRQSLLEAQKEISTSIINDSVRQKFLLETAEPTSNELARYSRHTDAQRKIARQSLTTATIQEATDDATLNYAEDIRVAADLQSAGLAAAKEAVAQGFGPEAVVSASDAAQSQVAKASILGAIAGRNTSRATELFAEFIEKDADTGKATLEGEDLLSTTLMLNNHIDLEKAQERADVSVELSTNEDGTIDEDMAKGLLRETPGLKGKELKDAMDQLNIRIIEANSIKAQRMEKSETDLNQHLAGGGDAVEWASRNSEQWLELQGDSQVAKRIQSYREFQARGQQFSSVSDGTSWSRLILDPTLGDRNLETFKGQLTESEYQSLVKAQAAALGKGADGQSSGEVRAVFTNARNIMKRASHTIPGISEEGSEDAAKTRLMLERRIDEFVQSFTDQGKEPSQLEIGAEATRLIMQVQTGSDIDSGTTIFGHRFGAGKAFFTGIAAQKSRISLSAQQGMIVPIDIMSEQQKAEWSQFYINAGIEPTDKMLEQLGGAIAMDDAARVLRLLTRRVKENE